MCNRQNIICDSLGIILYFIPTPLAFITFVIDVTPATGAAPKSKSIVYHFLITVRDLRAAAGFQLKNAHPAAFINLLQNFGMTCIKLPTARTPVAEAKKF